LESFHLFLEKKSNELGEGVLEQIGNAEINPSEVCKLFVLFAEVPGKGVMLLLGSKIALYEVAQTYDHWGCRG
jgi:hypothetical protein